MDYTVNKMDKKEGELKRGDKVRVINYGHHIWEWQEINSERVLKTIDICPETVGRKGIIDKIITTQSITNYGLTQIKGKLAWYHRDQLEKI